MARGKPNAIDQSACSADDLNADSPVFLSTIEDRAKARSPTTLLPATARRRSTHCGKNGYRGVVAEFAFVETDSRSRAVLPGRPNQRFVMRENPDGSILLQPARVVTNAQHEFDTDPELRELLTRATASPTVRRARARRT